MGQDGGRSGFRDDVEIVRRQRDELRDERDELADFIGEREGELQAQREGLGLTSERAFEHALKGGSPSLLGPVLLLVPAALLAGLALYLWKATPPPLEAIDARTTTLTWVGRPTTEAAPEDGADPSEAWPCELWMETDGQRAISTLMSCGDEEVQASGRLSCSVGAQFTMLGMFQYELVCDGETPPPPGREMPLDVGGERYVFSQLSQPTNVQLRAGREALPLFRAGPPGNRNTDAISADDFFGTALPDLHHPNPQGADPLGGVEPEPVVPGADEADAPGNGAAVEEAP